MKKTITIPITINIDIEVEDGRDLRASVRNTTIEDRDDQIVRLRTMLAERHQHDRMMSKLREDWTAFCQQRQRNV
jgi:hypothetical protein